MPVDLPESDPIDRDPREKDLERRSGAPAISPWLIIGLILLIGLGVYAASALF